ncbi:unnamed protein product [Boreogadus saida]
MTEGDASHTLDEASCSSAQGSLQGATDTSMAAVLWTALAHLQLDAAQTESAQASALFRRNPVPATFSVPPSEEYLKELHACWRDTRAQSHSTSDARTLAAMQNVAQVGLGRMPSVEPAITSLILAPDEALRPNARHLITPVAYGGLSGLRNSLRMAFGPPNAYLPGSLVPHNPTDAPPEPQEAGGAGARPSGLVMVPLVLEAMSSPPFEPLTQIGLKWLSMKVAFLLAITTVKWVGEFRGSYMPAVEP